MLLRSLLPCFLLLTAGALCGAGRAQPEPERAPIVLDRQRVLDLIREQAPEVQVARARVGEARALQVGAGVAAPANPELGVFGGPRLFPGNQVLADWGLSLQWPIDLSSARPARIALAQESVAAADSAALAVTRMAAAEALELWLRTLAAMERVQLEQQRSAVDEAVVRVAQARRRAGTTGDTDVALALVVHADGVARLRGAEAQRDAGFAVLRSRLGLLPLVPVQLLAAGLDDEPPPLSQLLTGMDGRADLQLLAARQRVAHADATLQRRIGAPLPHLSATGGRANEYYFEAGMSVPLPVYQRNQTNRAVAEARTRTVFEEERAARLTAEGELRSAYALYQGARSAHRALTEAIPAIADADHLATRGYELGQGTLAGVLAARREVLEARLALLEAQTAARRARMGVDLAAGLLP